MKHFKIILFTALLAAGLTKPNQAAPSQAAQLPHVIVAGNFHKPGSYKFSGQWRLTDAIVAGGGITVKPDAVRLGVLRDSKMLRVDAVGLLQHPSDVSQNILLQSGDVVVAVMQEDAEGGCTKKPTSSTPAESAS